MTRHIVKKEFTDMLRDGRFRWCSILVGALLLISLGHGWFQAEERAFAEEWRGFFVPAILAGEQMDAGVLPDLLRFELADEEPADVARRAAVPLTVLFGLLLLVGAGAGVRLGRVRGAE